MPMLQSMEETSKPFWDAKDRGDKPSPKMDGALNDGNNSKTKQSPFGK
jgi:hypothetical protein